MAKYSVEDEESSIEMSLNREKMTIDDKESRVKQNNKKIQIIYRTHTKQITPINAKEIIGICAAVIENPVSKNSAPPKKKKKKKRERE